mgnify:FL=1
MKRQLTLVALMLACLSMWADPVGREAAKQTAKQFLQKRGVEMTAQQPAHRAPRKGKTEKENSYYYVFNAGNDQGYVIVSGDSRTEEILGYVEHGTYDESALPEHMKAWLQGYADQIQYLDDHAIKGTTPKQRAAARRRMTATRHALPALLTCAWNQNDPYNLKCPSYYKADGTELRPATGCVATALTQVMYYYKHPKCTMAEIPSISNTYPLASGGQKVVTAKAVRSYTRIDWANMQDHYSGRESQEAKDAVANVMLYVGQSVKMNYGSTSGAGFGGNVIKALTNIFNYQKGCYMAERGNYTADSWYDLIYSEIASGHPVTYAGRSTGGGHAFVLDGFDGGNLFHVNWGWGGSNNGWFLIDVLNPGDNTGIGASTSSDGYSLGHTALINLRVPGDTMGDPTTKLTIREEKIDGTSIYAKYVNWTMTTNNFDYGIIYQDKEGNYVPVGGRYETAKMTDEQIIGKSFNMQKLLPEGTWKLSPASELHSAKVWRPQYNMRDVYIEAVVDAEGNVSLRKTSGDFRMSMDNLVCIGPREVGTQQEIQVTFTNHGDEYLRELSLYANTGSSKNDVNSRAMVSIKKGETKTYSFFFNPNSAGTYNVWVCADRNPDEVVGKGQITIAASGQGDKPKLALQMVSIKNSQNGVVYGTRLNGVATIKNNGTKPFVGKVVTRLWRQPGGSGAAYGSTSLTHYMEIEPGRTAQAPFDYSGLDYGNTYLIQVRVYGQDIDGGNLWNNRYACKEGILAWKENGVLSGMAPKSSLITGASLCAILIDQCTVRRVIPNKNPNTIYAVTPGTSTPSGIDNRNLVIGDSAQSLALTSGHAYFVPQAFRAVNACFKHTFPEEGNGQGWQTITLPFAADSISVAGKSMALDDPLNHCWIYDFAWTENDGTPVFSPAKQICANTPYLIAADSCLNGQTIEFHATDVPISATESSKAVVSSNSYSFKGITLAENKKNVYSLNSEGTAFEFSEAAVTAIPTGAYFTTSLDESSRLPAILLPKVPTSLDTAVKDVKAEVQNGNDNVYSITGQCVGTAAMLRSGKLAPGIYVMKGRTILVK